MTSDGRATGVVGYNVQAACEDSGITAYVPKPLTSNSKAAGRFSKAHFIYIPRDDEYLLAYNLKRVIAILGMPKTMKEMKLVGG